MIGLPAVTKQQQIQCFRIWSLFLPNICINLHQISKLRNDEYPEAPQINEGKINRTYILSRSSNGAALQTHWAILPVNRMDAFTFEALCLYINQTKCRSLKSALI
jgi:hypothetical protein